MFAMEAEVKRGKDSDLIRKHYTDLENPGAFTGLQGFLKDRNNKVGNKKQVAEALSALPTF